MTDIQEAETIELPPGKVLVVPFEGKVPPGTRALITWDSGDNPSGPPTPPKLVFENHGARCWMCTVLFRQSDVITTAYIKYPAGRKRKGYHLTCIRAAKKAQRKMMKSVRQ